MCQSTVADIYVSYPQFSLQPWKVTQSFFPQELGFGKVKRFFLQRWAWLNVSSASLIITFKYY